MAVWLPMELVFVHGYSVRNTATYGELPSRLEQEMARRGHEVRVDHIYLGKYVSFNDSVTLDDLSRAFDAAVREKGLKNFACITHSTGGPLVRNWMMRHESRAMTHLVMLAPANHGSALAQLGKGRLSRIKAFLESVEPGQKILDWLELGSEEQWALNRDWMERDWTARGQFCFVLTGQTIDRKLYDHLNSYTGEPGSDGVVRVAAANLNYDFVRVAQQEDGSLKPVSWNRSQDVPMAVLPGLSHGGATRGIMTSVGISGAHPTVEVVMECLDVRTASDFESLGDQFRIRTARSQAEERDQAQHSMLCLRVVDDGMEPLEDYDVLFTAGEEASPDHLPQGFCRDRQRNTRNKGRLTYYFDHGKLDAVPIGLEVIARPENGLVRFEKAVIAPQELGAILRPNETMMLEIVLRRKVDRNCFLLTENRASENISGEASGVNC
jgi:hypothetical protein